MFNEGGVASIVREFYSGIGYKLLLGHHGEKEKRVPSATAVRRMFLEEQQKKVILCDIISSSLLLYSVYPVYTCSVLGAKQSDGEKVSGANE